MIFGLFLFGLHLISGTKTLQVSVKTFISWLSPDFEDKNSSNFGEDFFHPP